MSNADKIFVDMCQKILNEGTDTKGEKVRPTWKDTGESAYTKKIFGHVARYDLRKEFPAITLRRTPIKSAINEILWIFQKKSNNINELKPHIWDSWADENGSIGKAYGYQIGKKFIHHKKKYDVDTEFAQEVRNVVKDEFKTMFMTPLHNDYKPTSVIIPKQMDQMDAVLYDLKNTPFSRRILTNMYNHQDLHEMSLYPCCWSCTFNVTDEGGDKLVLNMVLNQRSNDVLAANNWNVVQYAALLMMVAQSVGMVAGTLLHIITDAHIYDRHIPIVEELITRQQYDAPIVTLDPDIKDFYKFTENSFSIENYQYGEQITNIPIAV